MPKVRLTELTLKQFKAGSSRIDYFDETLRGFGVRISGTVKTYFLMHGPAEARVRTGLGRADVVRLADAREAAKKLLAAQTLSVQLTTTRDEPKIEAVAEIGTRLEWIVVSFLDRWEKPRNRSWRDTDRIFALHVIPKWQGRQLATLTRKEIIEHLNSIVDDGAPIGANRVLAHLRKMLNWAVDQSLLEVNPSSRIKAPSPENKGTRDLQPQEVITVWEACRRLGYPFGSYIQFLLLTAQRRTETAIMQWPHMSHNEQLWTIPPENNKGNRTHLVPLSPQALAILTPLPRQGDYLFSSTGGMTPISGFSKFKKKLDKLLVALAEEGFTPVDPFTIHDLRRTAGTLMGMLAINRFVQDRVMNHVDNSLQGRYDRWAYLPEKRDALDKIGQYLETLVTKTPAAVA